MNGVKIAIIGAGSTYTPELIEGLIFRKEKMPLRELACMDIDGRKLEIVGGLARRMLAHAGLTAASAEKVESRPAKVVLTRDINAALDGADFVFIQIRVGKLRARHLDETIPLKHNLIGQETTGIGGFFKALRTIPVLLDITSRMEKLCPGAWLLNFSNPSGICAQALLDHTKAKTLGLCNAPIEIMKYPAAQFSSEPADVDYVGLNHLSFVTSIRQNGRDFLREAINGNDELLKKLDGQMGFSADIIRKTGGVPSYYLHYFINPREALKKLQNATQTRAEECMKIEEELLAMYSDAELYEKPKMLEKRGGAMYSRTACALAESIFTNDGKVHVVNTYNNGAIPFMRDSDVVETRATVGNTGAKTLAPVVVGGEYIQGLMQSVKAYERLTVKAAVTGSRDAAISALMLNPLIGDHDAATACFNEMLHAHREFLPQFS